MHHNGDPDTVFYEANTDQSVLQTLQSQGHNLQKADILGRVQAIFCPKGATNAVGCQAKADTRGDGLGAVLLGQ